MPPPHLFLCYYSQVGGGGRISRLRFNMSTKRAREKESKKEHASNKKAKTTFTPYLFLGLEGLCEYNTYYLLRPKTKVGKELLRKVEALIYAPEEEYSSHNYQDLLFYLTNPLKHAKSHAEARAKIEDPATPLRMKRANQDEIDRFNDAVPDWLRESYTAEEIAQHIGDCKIYSSEDYPRLDEPIFFRSFITQ